MIGAGGPIGSLSVGVIAPGIEVTYDELVALIDADELVSGYTYTITDYQTIYLMPNTVVTMTMPIEPLTVRANSTNTLDPLAFSASNPNDWIIYDVTGTSIVEVNAAAGGNKGAIYKRVDTRYNIGSIGDFRTIEYRRWATNTSYAMGTVPDWVLSNTSQNIGITDNISNANPGNLSWTAISTSAYDATLRATAGVLTSLLLVDGGTTNPLGFGLFTTTPTIAIATQGGGAAATAHFTLNSTGGVKSVTVTAPGSNYNDGVVLAVVHGSGTGAVLRARLDATGGIASVDVLNCGSGYTTSGLSISVTADGSGSGATLDAVLGYTVATVVLDTGGTNYTNEISYTITGDGFGLTVSALENPYGYRDFLMFPELGSGTETMHDIFINGNINWTGGVATLPNCVFKRQTDQSTYEFYAFVTEQSCSNNTIVGNVVENHFFNLVGNVLIKPIGGTSNSSRILSACINAEITTTFSCNQLGSVFASLNNNTVYHPTSTYLNLGGHIVGIVGKTVRDSVMRPGIYAPSTTSAFSGFASLRVDVSMRMAVLQGAASVTRALIPSGEVSIPGNTQHVFPRITIDAYLRIDYSTLAYTTTVTGYTTWNFAKLYPDSITGRSLQANLYQVFSLVSTNAVESVISVDNRTKPFKVIATGNTQWVLDDGASFEIPGGGKLILDGNLGQTAEFELLNSKWQLIAHTGTITTTVTAKTAAYTLLCSDNTGSFSNRATTALVAFTLTASLPVGWEATFMVVDTDGLSVTPEGAASIQFDTGNNGVGTAVTSTAVGSVMKIKKESTTLYVSVSLIGTWT